MDISDVDSCSDEYYDEFNMWLDLEYPIIKFDDTETCFCEFLRCMYPNIYEQKFNEWVNQLLDNAKYDNYEDDEEY